MKGFTLIELIMAVAIIGILSAIAIQQFTNLQSGINYTQQIPGEIK